MVYTFGSFSISLEQGSKSENDYVLKYNGIEQFDDLKCFKNVLIHFNTLTLFKVFINSIKNSGFLTFKRSEISSPCKGLSDTSPIDILHNYVCNLSLTDIQKGLIFASILRMDIDNICYPPSTGRFNGAIRHFIQLILLGGFKYNCFKLIKDIGFINSHPNTNDIDIINFVFRIGFPRNNYGITTTDFKIYYQNYFSLHNPS